MCKNCIDYCNCFVCEFYEECDGSLKVDGVCKVFVCNVPFAYTSDCGGPCDSYDDPEENECRCLRCGGIFDKRSCIFVSKDDPHLGICFDCYGFVELY